VSEQGIEAIADAVMARYFHEGFRKNHPAVVARYRQRLVSTDTAGYIGCCAAVGAVDTTARLGGIVVPALVAAGELDQGTPIAMAEVLAEGIPGARLEVLAEASHLGAIEQPRAFAACVMEFLGGL
jgi:3-oxoadipate enol-lactonase